MNAKVLQNRSETDWTRIDAMSDEEIDPAETPPLDEQFFARATWRLPSKRAEVTLSVEAEVLEWYQAQGAEFQRRIEAALRTYAEAHKQHQRVA